MVLLVHLEGTLLLVESYLKGESDAYKRLMWAFYKTAFIL